MVSSDSAVLRAEVRGVRRRPNASWEILRVLQVSTSPIATGDSISLKIQLRDQKPEDHLISEVVDASRSIGKATEASKNRGKPHSPDNPLMAGFPPPNYEQHRDLLLLHGYTEQVTRRMSSGR